MVAMTMNKDWTPDKERDQAIAEFFQELTKILKEVMPLIKDAVKKQKERD